MELLRVSGLNKTFGAHAALSDISFGIRPGEVHALIGENGAGKSTLIKILTGVYSFDSGEIVWQGRNVGIPNPKAARALGINAVHQDRHLIPSFTGYENLFLGTEYPAAMMGAGIRWGEMKARAHKAAEELGVSLPLTQPASLMSPPEKTMLEIVRAMMQDCRLLILDEPTASLTDQESERLFELIDRLTKKGTAILYVSHRLEEILRISDRITVFRNGKNVITVDTKEADQDQLIQWMSGISVQREHRSRAMSGEAVLAVDKLTSSDGKIRNISLTVRKGEITGLFGLAGAGRTELLEAIYGLRGISSGSITVDGKTVTIRSPRQALDHRMVLIPEERKRDALVMPMSVRENMTLSIMDRFRRWLRIDARKERETAAAWMESMKVKASGIEQPVQELSGGNQQKVVFAKALLTQPKVLLCDEPTQAVDVATRGEIHRLLREQADQGNAVLLVTSDLHEMLDIADRLYILREGEIAAEFINDGVTPEQVLQICFQTKKGGNG